MSEGNIKINDIADIESALKKELEKVRIAKRNTIVGTVVLAAVMIGYLTWLYTNLAYVIKPDFVAGTITDVVSDQIPQVQGHLEKVLRDDSYMYADQAMSMLESQMPEIRVAMENYVENKVEKAFRVFEQKFESTFEEELTQLRKKSIRRHLQMLGAANEPDKRALSAKIADKDKMSEALVAELERAYRQDTMTRILPEFFESWTTVTAEKAIGTFKDRVQAFDVELQRLCKTPENRLSQEDFERKQMVLCLAAYFESLFASEGEKIIDRIFYLMETSSKKISLHFKGKIGTNRNDNISKVGVGVKADKKP